MKINDKISEIVYKKTHKKTIPFEFTIKTSDIYKRIIESLKNEGFLGKKVVIPINNNSSEYEFYFMYKIVKKPNFFTAGAIEMYLFSNVEYITEDIYTEYYEYGFYNIYEELQKDIKKYKYNKYRHGLILVCNINEENEYSDKFIYESPYSETGTVILPVCLIEKTKKVYVTTIVTNNKSVLYETLYKGLRKDFVKVISEHCDMNNEKDEK